MPSFEHVKTVFIKIAAFLNWTLVEEETDDGLENYKIWHPNKVYKVFLDGLEIATTKLERGDSPMGVASGVLNFKDKNFGYKEIKEFCIKNNIETSMDEPEDKCISTMSLENNLKIINENGVEIKGIGGVNISGMDFDWYEIAILGISYPFYENEFPKHVKAYENYFKNK